MSENIDTVKSMPETPKRTFVRVKSFWQKKEKETQLRPRSVTTEESPKSASSSGSGKKKHEYYAMTLGRPVQLSPQIAEVGREDDTVGKNNTELRSWYRKYQKDETRKEAADKEKEQGNGKTSSVTVVNDMSKWYVVQYANAELVSNSSAVISQAEPSPVTADSVKRENVVEKLWNKRRKQQQEQIKAPVTLPYAELALTKNEIRRQEIIYEFIVTERDYVNDMKVLSNLIIKKIREKKLLSPTGIKKVFSNAEEIVGINELLYKKLFERRASNFEAAVTTFTANGSNSRKRAAAVIQSYTIGDLILTLTPYLRSYAQYCSNHTEAAEYLQQRLANADGKQVANKNATLRKGKEDILLKKEEQKQKDKDLSLFLQYCSFRPECRNLDIYSFLIKPVQRICKYPLLIKELLKFTDKTHQDHHLLSRALTLIEKVVSEVNERRRFLEGQQSRMVELRKLLNFDDAMLIGFNNSELKKNEDAGKFVFDILGEPSRKLLKEYMQDVIQLYDIPKTGSTVEIKNCSKRWLILCNDVVILAKPSEKGLFTSDNTKANVKMVFKLLDILRVHEGVEDHPDMLELHLGSKKKRINSWHLVLDVLGKTQPEEGQQTKKTLKKKKLYSNVSRIVFTFASQNKDLRDELVKRLADAAEEARKDADVRKKIIVDKTTKDEQNNENITASRSDLEQALAAIDKQFAAQLKSKGPEEEEAISLGLPQIQLIAQSLNVKSSPSLQKIPLKKDYSTATIDRNHAKLIALYSSSLPTANFLKQIPTSQSSDGDLNEEKEAVKSLVQINNISRSSMDLFHEVDEEDEVEDEDPSDFDFRKPIKRNSTGSAMEKIRKSIELKSPIVAEVTGISDGSAKEVVVRQTSQEINDKERVPKIITPPQSSAQLDQGEVKSVDQIEVKQNDLIEMKPILQIEATSNTLKDEVAVTNDATINDEEIPVDKNSDGDFGANVTTLVDKDLSIMINSQRASMSDEQASTRAISSVPQKLDKYLPGQESEEKLINEHCASDASAQVNVETQGNEDDKEGLIENDKDSNSKNTSNTSDEQASTRAMASVAQKLDRLAPGGEDSSSIVSDLRVSDEKASVKAISSVSQKLNFLSTAGDDAPSVNQISKSPTIQSNFQSEAGKSEDEIQQGAKEEKGENIQTTPQATDQNSSIFYKTDSTSINSHISTKPIYQKSFVSVGQKSKSSMAKSRESFSSSVEGLYRMQMSDSQESIDDKSDASSVVPPVRDTKMSLDSSVLQRKSSIGNVKRNTIAITDSSAFTYDNSNNSHNNTNVPLSQTSKKVSALAAKYEHLVSSSANSSMTDLNAAATQPAPANVSPKKIILVREVSVRKTAEFFQKIDRKAPTSNTAPNPTQGPPLSAPRPKSYFVSLKKD